MKDTQNRAEKKGTKNQEMRQKNQQKMVDLNRTVSIITVSIK